MSASPDLGNLAWLTTFVQRFGRPPRILHLDNIANNAYLNAKILRRIGLECDVLCRDNYHIMSSPEWEEGDFPSHGLHQLFPAWERVEIPNFRRPCWFVQGPTRECLKYLLAVHSGGGVNLAAAWEQLEQQRISQSCWHRGEWYHPRTWRLFSQRAIRRLTKVLRKLPALLSPVSDQPGSSRQDATSSEQARAAELQEAFQQHFPDRLDQLVFADLVSSLELLGDWRRLLAHYDAVIGYALSGIIPLLADSRPYFTYEHGTIRSLPFEASSEGRICALTYRLAEETFITNCDNWEAARKLQLPRYRFVPHPVNEDQRPSDESGLRAQLQQQLQATFLVFHPSRQHWTSDRHPSWEKGNDILIKGLARFIHEVCPQAGAVFVDWGQTVAQTRQLLTELGIAQRVLWVPPLPNRRMLSYLQACDVLADQFFLGAFGSTTPKGLMMARPVLLYLNEEQHRPFFPNLPPVLNCRAPEQVFEALSRLYHNPVYAHQLGQQGAAWYRSYHSNSVIANTLLDSFRRLLTPEGPATPADGRVAAA